MSIELRQVGFSNESEVLLTDVDLSITSGSSVAIMGPSGSGKSLLLKVIAGLVPATEGSVRIDGVDLWSASERSLVGIRKRYGFVFQDSALWQNITARNNVALPFQYHNPDASGAEINDSIAALARRLSVDFDLDQRPSRLSAGERKAVAFMRALVLKPRGLFLDEPTGGLDEERRQRVLSLVRQMHADGVTLVMASHDAELVSGLSDYMIVLDRGRVLAYDTLQAIAHREDERLRAIVAGLLDQSATYSDDILGLISKDVFDSGEWES